jgi:trimeric autotransporter adhesin
MGPQRRRTADRTLCGACTRTGMTLARGLIVLAGLTSGVAHAQIVQESFHVTNGPVHATALSGNTLYIGGDFTQVGPATGSFVSIDATTGVAGSAFPKVLGSVEDMVSDGAGGWYIGGSFYKVGGLPRANLAHVLADGTVAPWNPGADSNVLCMAAIGSTIYVGGFFSNVGGQPRNRIAALDAATGLATAWDPGVDTGPATHVRDIAVKTLTVYVGGYFTSVGGQLRNNIAALDATVNTNNARPWNPNSNGTVDALAISGATIYAGGTFTNIGGQPRNRIAALNEISSNALTWNPNADAFVYGLAVSGNTVYACGFFSTIGGQTRNNIAALDATIATNNATAWNPNANSTVQSMFVNGTVVYASGSFTSIGGQTRHRLAALDVVTGNATAWDPRLGNAAFVLGVNGGAVVVGGAFTTVGGVARNRIAAIDVTTGLPTGWNPDADDLVRAIVVNGSTVYAAGRFGRIGGQFRNRIAALDATVNSGNATAWNPTAAGNNVYALALSGTTLYVGGEFSSIGGQSRNRIAALNTTLNTNNATAWNPNASDIVRALVVSGSTVYAGGDFFNIGGRGRSRIAALDANLNTVNATSWDPLVSSGAGGPPSVNALAISGTTVYAGGNFGFIGGQVRANIAALDATIPTNQATPWNPGANYFVHALLVDGTTVYAGGFFDEIGGETRNGMAALDATVDTDNALPWNPSAPSGALSFAQSGTTIYAGGYFPSIGDAPQSFLAAIATVSADVETPGAGPGAAFLLPNTPNPFGASTVVRFTLARSEVVDLAVFDLAGREVTRLVAGERLGPGTHEVELRGGDLPAGVYLSRLKTGGGFDVRRMVHVR